MKRCQLQCMWAVASRSRSAALVAAAREKREESRRFLPLWSLWNMTLWSVACESDGGVRSWAGRCSSSDRIVEQSASESTPPNPRCDVCFISHHEETFLKVLWLTSSFLRHSAPFRMFLYHMSVEPHCNRRAKDCPRGSNPISPHQG